MSKSLYQYKLVVLFYLCIKPQIKWWPMSWHNKYSYCYLVYMCTCIRAIVLHLLKSCITLTVKIIISETNHLSEWTCATKIVHLMSCVCIKADLDDPSTWTTCIHKLYNLLVHNRLFVSVKSGRLLHSYIAERVSRSLLGKSGCQKSTINIILKLVPLCQTSCSIESSMIINLPSCHVLKKKNSSHVFY